MIDPKNAERPSERPWSLERELTAEAIRAETEGKGGVEIHAGGYCLGVWVDHEHDGHSPRMERMLRRANQYDQMRRVLAFCEAILSEDVLNAVTGDYAADHNIYEAIQRAQTVLEQAKETDCDAET